MYSVTFVSMWYPALFDKKYLHAYFSRMVRTLLIPKPMVIFNEEDEIGLKIKAVREAYGFADITTMINRPLSTFPIHKILTDAEEEWKRKSMQDSRVSVLSRIIHGASFDMIREIMITNPFHTTHVARININLLGITPNNSLNYVLPDVFDKILKICDNPSPKIRLSVLNCWSPQDYQDLSKFYSTYHYIVASGFITAEINDESISIFDELSKITLEHASQGYIIGDEAQFAFIIDRHPEAFRLYIGDYQDLVHNYFKPESNQQYIEWVKNLYRNRGLFDRLSKIESEMSAC